MKNYGKKYISRFLVMLIAVCMLMVIPVFPAEYAYAADNATCLTLEGSNIGKNDYSWYWSDPMYSYITEYGNGYMTVTYTGKDHFTASYYDSAYKVTSRKDVKMRYPLFGGFYESQNYYFIVTGQDNVEEDDNKVVFNIAKYDRNWNFIGECSLKGATTVHPFDAGNCRMAIDGKYLIVRTCHEMYTSSDGLNHQANVTIVVDTDQMDIYEAHYLVESSSFGYVSHSFNQFIKVDDHCVVTLDHGDAYPRALTLNLNYREMASEEYYTDYTDGYDLYRFKGATGDNYTGTSLGGLEVGSEKYVIAFNSMDQSEGSTDQTRNLFIAAVDKENLTMNLRQLTNYQNGETTVTNPQLVKLDDDSFMILWTEKGQIVFTIFDQDLELKTRAYAIEGDLSDCHPEYINGKVVWYTYEDNQETFYAIPVNDVENSEVITHIYGHDYKLLSCKDHIAEVSCNKCGIKTKIATPSYVDIYYEENDFENDYNYGSYSDWQDSIKYDIYYEFNDTDLITNNEVIVAAENPDKCIVDQANREISFKAPGEYTLKIYPKYDPNNVITSTVTATKQLEGVTIKSESGTTVEENSEVRIKAEANGGRGYIEYQFTAKDPDGNKFTLNNDFLEDNVASWHPEKPGTYKVKVKATDVHDNDRTVESSELTIKVTEKKYDYTTELTKYNTTVSKISNKTYKGKKIKPSPTVKVYGSKLIKGTDYTLSYSKNLNVGTATVKIKGIGEYSGTIKKTFKIVPKTPVIRKPEAAKKTVTVNWKALKSKMSKKRITGYQVQIAKNNKFTKGKKSFKVKGYKETSYKFTKLKSKTKYYVRIRAYKAISGKTYYSKWSKVKNIKTL